MRALALLAVALLAVPAAAEDVRRIAITIDDAPREATHFSGPERAARLIAGLESAGIQATFFCVTSRFDEEGRARIDSYRRAGHRIASHSDSHPSLHDVGAAAFLADVATASRVLAGVPDARPWFRYPYLHEGRTTEERDVVRAGLRDAGLVSGYVTVDDYDWYMDRLYQEALEQKREIDDVRLGQTYVRLLVESVEFYDGIARTALGRSPAHVLLLHENDLAALYLADLVTALRAKGWQIIGADEAFADPIAAMEPQTLLTGQGRVVALAIDRGYAGPRAIWEDEDELRAEFERSGAFR